MTNAPAKPDAGLEAKLLRFLARPDLPRWLASLAVVLGTPSLFLGFHLDEIVGQYIYSNLEGASRLYDIYQGGYGIANGNPEDTHWQMEEGFAPWWTYPALLIRMARPISQALHDFDFGLFPGWPALMHAHNLVWTGALAFVATRMYRGALGVLVGGMAALLFAIDHTHGFVVGYIANRHALVTAVFGVLALERHLHSRKSGSRLSAASATALYAASLLSGESGIAIAGYLFAYAVFVEEGTLLRRALTFAPYLVVTVVWRATYNAAGLGASGSGLYIDPMREPLSFLPAIIERGPILLLGQFLAPPAELYTIGGPLLARVMLVLAVVFVVTWGVALLPLLRRDRMARFWAAGMLIALVPAGATYPHNRQLLFASFGAMALIAQIWHWHALELKRPGAPTPTRLVSFSGGVGAVVLFAHLVASPIALPVTTCSILAATPIEAGIDDVGDEIAGKDAVFVTAPDYFAVKLVQFSRRVNQQVLPRKWRAVSFGPQAITVGRTDARTLRVDYDGGILASPFMQLYRDARIPMSPGERIDLEGLTITVREVTPDGRARVAEFVFEASLDDPRYVFYVWNGEGFSLYTPPKLGASETLPAALVPWGVK